MDVGLYSENHISILKRNDQSIKFLKSIAETIGCTLASTGLARNTCPTSAGSRMRSIGPNEIKF